MKNSQFDYRLYVITDGKADLLTRVEQALLGGATCIQYREKKKPLAEMIEEAKALKQLCHAYHVPLFINDHIEVAKVVEADGIHLGQADTTLQEARKVLGNIPIGISARNVKEAQEAELAGAAYVGVGAIFPTNSKSDATLVSMAEAKKIGEHISIPMLFIGGISLETLANITVPYHGLCVISAILSATDPKLATELLKRAASNNQKIGN